MIDALRLIPFMNIACLHQLMFASYSAYILHQRHEGKKPKKFKILHSSAIFVNVLPKDLCSIVTTS